MAINLRTTGIHHISLRTADLDRARHFYVDVLGLPVAYEAPGLCLVTAGQSLIGLRAPGDDTSAEDTFDPFRVGMDHFALSCPDESELRRVALALEKSGLWSTGIKELADFAAKYVAFKDPDGIKVELWLG